MIEIAIISNRKDYCGMMTRFVAEYGAASGERFNVKIFRDGMTFLNYSKGVFDLIIIRNEYCGMDPFKLAEHIRKHDRKVMLVFEADSAADAVYGYRYGAADYLVDPDDKTREQLLARAVAATAERAAYITVKMHGEVWRICARDILYVRKQNNYSIYKTHTGEYSEQVSLSVAAEKLKDAGKFVRCNSGCLINLALFDRMDKDSNTVFVCGERLPVSRGCKAKLKAAILDAYRIID